MFLSDEDSILISNLKGRLSKILTISKSLNREENKYLECIFETIDHIYLCSKDDTNRQIKLKNKLQSVSTFLEASDKKYIKKHILPLIKKITTRKWE